MEERKCLNGFWDFSMDLKGMDDLPHSWDRHPICVPSPYNINAFCRIRTKTVAGETFTLQGGDFCLYPDYPQEWEQARYGAYRRMFQVPAGSRGKRIFLHFDAVAYHSIFYVNGVKVREEVEAFLPIEIEVTDQVHYGGENEILVVTENSKAFMYKDEKGWNRVDYPKGSFWGEFVAGIWQDVWYVERPAVYLSDVFVVTDIWERTLTARFWVDGEVSADMRVQFSLLHPDGRQTSLGECAAADGTFCWNWQEGEVRLWEPQDPALYQLLVRLEGKAGVGDDKPVRFGFRSFTARGERFYLNKRPINLKNDSWHYMGYSIQTPEYARSYYRMAKDAGVNIIRLHAQPFPSFFYDVADEEGMMLVSESAVWASHCNFSYNDAFFENSRKHLIRLILRDRNHPSVVLWSPENECIPAYYYCGSRFVKDEAELKAKLYDFLKVIYEYDTSRLISCDGSGDLDGRLPVNSLHYPGFDCTTQRGKPITIGEMGSMYYSTPDMVCMERGQETLASFAGRLRAVGEDAYRNLMGERRWAAQICVFNLVWYGLEPLPFRDRLLTYEDETAPGIKPGRITPYLRTLNAGGDEELPEYRPNPVWELAKKAYLPVRSYIDRMPKQVYAGSVSELPLFLFYDEREDGCLDFCFDLEMDGSPVGSQKHHFQMKACEPRELTISIPWPDREGAVHCRAQVICQGKTVYEETYETEVYEEEKLAAAWKTFGLSLKDLGEAAEEEEGVFFLQGGKPEQAYEIRRIFGAEREFSLNRPFPGAKGTCRGKALYFDGKGEPLVWYVEKRGTGRIVTVLDLKHPSEPAHWLFLIELGTYLKNQVPQAQKPILFYGREDSPYALLLQKLHYAYEVVGEEALAGMLSERQKGILFVDGGSSMRFLANISRKNFDTVVLAGLSAVPELWSREFEVTGRRTWQAYPSGEAVKRFGLYGTSLYGLTVGQECVIGQNLIEYSVKPAVEVIYWQVPNIDWRLWNNDPEEIKTVCIHRSEQVDNSRLAVLSRLRRGESDVWINQLVPDVSHPKRCRLWREFLAGLGAGYGDEVLEEKDAEMVYDGALRCLWTEGGVRVTDTEKLPGGVRTGCLVYSAQERTNFLYNPDMVNMTVNAEQSLKVYLNGELLGEGRDLRFTSIGLRAGDNVLQILSGREQPFPVICLERANGEELDLKFYRG